MKKLHLELDEIRVDTFELPDGDDRGDGTVEGQQAVRYVTCGSATCDGPPCRWSDSTGYCVCPT